MLKTFVFVIIALFSANIYSQDEEKNITTARDFITALSQQDFKTAYEFFSDETKEKMPIEKLPQIWRQLTDEYGRFRAIGELKKTANGKNVIAVIEFERKSPSFLLAFESKGKIIGFTLAPAGS